MKRAVVSSKRLLFLPVLLLAGTAAAQTPVEDVIAAFDETLEEIAFHKSEVERLEARAAASEGLAAQILGTRRDRIWSDMFNMIVGLAEEVDELSDSGVDMSAYSDQVAAMLEEQAGGAFETINRLASNVEFPSDTLPPQEFVVQPGLIRLERLGFREEVQQVVTHQRVVVANRRETGHRRKIRIQPAHETAGGIAAQIIRIDVRCFAGQPGVFQKPLFVMNSLRAVKHQAVMEHVSFQ